MCSDTYIYLLSYLLLILFYLYQLLKVVKVSELQQDHLSLTSQPYVRYFPLKDARDRRETPCEANGALAK